MSYLTLPNPVSVRQEKGGGGDMCVMTYRIIYAALHSLPHSVQDLLQGVGSLLAHWPCKVFHTADSAARGGGGQIQREESDMGD